MIERLPAWQILEATNLVGEVWVPVANAGGIFRERYEVSNLGRVRSCDRMMSDSLGRTRTLRGRVLAQKRGNQYGHVAVGLSGPEFKKTLSVHRLVAESFLGPPSNGQVVRHINGERDDNRLENLAYGTPPENAADTVRHGTRATGEMHGGSKLDYQKVQVIRTEHERGAPLSSIAKRFGVTAGNVHAIVHQKTWKDERIGKHESPTIPLFEVPKTGDDRNDEWRPIPELPDYEASNHGQIRRSPFVTVTKAGLRRKTRGGILNTYPDKNGYLRVRVRTREGYKYQKVHVLVLSAFVGPPSDDQIVRHLDGDPANNHIDNLAYGTHAENAADRTKHRRTYRGADAVHTKLTEAQVIEVRNRADEGETWADLARDFGISRPAMAAVLTGEAWGHVGGPLNRRPGPATGERNIATKFTDDDIRTMRQLAQEGWENRRIAEEYGANPDYVSAVIHHRTRRDIDPESSSDVVDRRRKLDEEQVRLIISTYETGEESMTDLARRFGVSVGSISNIVNRKTWKHLQE